MYIIIVFTACSSGIEENKSKIETNTGNTKQIDLYCEEIYTTAYLDFVINKFNNENKGIIIQKNTFSHKEFYDTLSKKFMAGNKDIDLFLPSSIQTSYLINNHVMLDLSEQDDLINKFEEMFAGIFQNCKKGDYVFGVPTSFYSSHLLNFNKNLSELFIDYELPYKWTYDNAISILEKSQIMKQNISLYSFYVDSYSNIFLPSYIANQDLGNGNLDKELLRNLLQYAKKLIDNKWLCQREENIEKDILISGRIDKLFLFPKVKDNDYYPIFFDYLCIANSSENKDECIRFLSEFLSKENLKNGGYRKDFIIYKTDKSMLKNDANYEVYSYFMENARVFDFNLPGGYDIVRSYMKNEITLDETVDQVIGKMEMKLYE